MKNNSKQVVLEFNLPDFKREEIKIKLSGNAVIIKAEKKFKKKIQRKDFFHVEKSHRKFKVCNHSSKN